MVTRRMLHLLRRDPEGSQGHYSAVHPSLPFGVHHSMAPGAANMSQLPESCRMMSLQQNYSTLRHRRLARRSRLVRASIPAGVTSGTTTSHLAA
ncbi:hypothetical protein evm_008988 [Chilo suppressalis]|nr:hypothetical protein evm_008988 [Chilo suppressalis]